MSGLMDVRQREALIEVYIRLGECAASLCRDVLPFGAQIATHLMPVLCGIAKPDPQLWTAVDAT